MTCECTAAQTRRNFTVCFDSTLRSLVLDAVWLHNAFENETEQNGVLLAFHQVAQAIMDSMTC